MKRDGIDRELLASLVRSYRESRDIPLRTAAEEMGLSASTLSRIERVAALPDLPTVERLMKWIGQPLSKVVAAAPTSRKHKEEREAADTLSALQLQLRADSNIEDDDAEALMNMFKSAYLHLVMKKQKGPKGAGK